jgi:hypothetical protein
LHRIDKKAGLTASLFLRGDGAAFLRIAERL